MLTSAAETPSLDIMVTDYCFGGEADGLRMLERLRRLSTSSSRTAPESQIGPRATINARERERPMRGIRDPNRTQAFLLCFGPIRQFFCSQAASAARVALPQTPRGPLLSLARIHRSCAKAVRCILSTGHTFYPLVSITPG
jgi:hypothetical protein